jgi:hypothetical protein
MKRCTALSGNSVSIYCSVKVDFKLIRVFSHKKIIVLTWIVIEVTSTFMSSRTLAVIEISPR